MTATSGAIAAGRSRLVRSARPGRGGRRERFVEPEDLARLDAGYGGDERSVALTAGADAGLRRLEITDELSVGACAVGEHRRCDGLADAGVGPGDEADHPGDTPT